jgi:hypothetical protein
MTTLEDVKNPIQFCSNVMEEDRLVNDNCFTDLTIEATIDELYLCQAMQL